MFGCNKFKSDHPQAEVLDQNATDLTAKSIITYTTEIDKKLPSLTKQTSLVYMLGDLSFYAIKYSENGKTVLIEEHAFNGVNNKSIKEYYLKNDSLILEKTSSKLENDDEATIKESRTYLRSNTVFKIENRTASSNKAINSIPYIDLALSQSKTTDKDFMDKINSLNEVLDGRDKFEMVFDNITTYPDSRYILLKSKLQNGYSASILVKQKDQLIDSLLNDPINFKDQKLVIKWNVIDQEAVYIPVVKNTSASGLNK